MNLTSHRVEEACGKIRAMDTTLKERGRCYSAVATMIFNSKNPWVVFNVKKVYDCINKTARDNHAIRIALDDVPFYIHPGERPEDLYDNIGEDGARLTTEEEPSTAETFCRAHLHRYDSTHQLGYHYAEHSAYMDPKSWYNMHGNMPMKNLARVNCRRFRTSGDRPISR